MIQTNPATNTPPASFLDCSNNKHEPEMCPSTHQVVRMGSQGLWWGRKSEHFREADSAVMTQQWWLSSDGHIHTKPPPACIAMADKPEWWRAWASFCWLFSHQSCLALTGWPFYWKRNSKIKFATIMSHNGIIWYAIPKEVLTYQLRTAALDHHWILGR